MQTFLPYPDFVASARCLDRRRLGKQRVEVLQLLRALLVPGSGWANHPAVAGRPRLSRESSQQSAPERPGVVRSVRLGRAERPSLCLALVRKTC